MNKAVFLILATSILDLCFASPNYTKGKSMKRCKGKGKGHKCNMDFLIIAPGANVTLTCPFQAGKYHFSKEYTHIGPQYKTDRYKVSGKALTIKKFVTMDSGRYSCLGITNGRKVDEWQWVLHIKLKTNSGKAKYADRFVGGNFVIHCNKDIRQLYYSPDKKSPLLLLNLNGGVNSNQRVYQLSHLNRQDSGYYYCAKYIHGILRIRGIFHLVVKGLPKISGPKLAAVGDSVRLTCKYSGMHRIAWYKDGKAIAGSKVRRDKIRNKKQVLRLNLTNVQPGLDSGEYSCVVKGGTSSAKSKITFEVLAFEKNICGIYGDYKENNLVQIWCLTNLDERSKPRNIVHSLLHKPLGSIGSKFKPADRDIFPASPGIFFINPLKKKHEGFYKCKASLQGVTIEYQLNDAIWVVDETPN